MRTRSPAILHLLALLFALVQGVLPAAIATADGDLVAAGISRGTVHVEEQGGGVGCHAVHTDACELCRLLSHDGPPPPPAPALPALTRAAALPPAFRVSARSADRAPFALPRGPPTA